MGSKQASIPTPVTKFTRFGTVSGYVTLGNIHNPPHNLLNIDNLSNTALVNTLDHTVG